MQPGKIAQVTPNRQVEIETWLLKDYSYFTKRFFGMRPKIMSGNLDRARPTCHQARQQSEQCGLARTIGADKRAEGPLLDIEADVVQSTLRAICVT